MTTENPSVSELVFTLMIQLVTADLMVICGEFGKIKLTTVLINDFV